MFKNYFKTALRNLSRNRIYAFINIAGLSIGLACAMLILLYVKDEVSFDKFHKSVNHIYRIVSEQSYQGEKRKDGNTGYFQGPRFQQNVPGIKAFVRVQSGYNDMKTGLEVQSRELLHVDSNFFSVFTFPLLYGDAKNCLKEPHSIVLSEDEAVKQFGKTDAIGKTVMLKEDESDAFVPYKVTAVARRSPQNSSLRFEVLLPFKESEEDAQNNDNWFNFFLNTFLVLDDNTNPRAVEKNMQHFYIKDASLTFKKMQEKYGNGGTIGSYFLQPYTNMHMNTELPPQNGLVNASNPMYSYILSGIALFVLLIACINFINLTIARSVKRAKEIGIRKVVGGARNQLIMQFLGESFLLCTIAFLFAVVLVQLLLPLFNELANKALSLSYLLDAKLIASYIILYLLTGLLAGFYPALILSGYTPVKTLYSRFNIGGKNYLQKSLVVLQFTLASSLITATLIIYSQFKFLTTENLGYDDKNLVSINKDRIKHTDASVFKNELLKNQDIIGVSARNGGSWGTTARNAMDTTINFAYETVDENYIPLLKISLIAGRNFSKDYPADSTRSVIVNESFVKAAGWKNPVGEIVNFWYNNEVYHVIGVVKDYHSYSLNQKISPQLFTMKNDNLYGTYLIKIKPGTQTASLKFIQKTFKQFYPVSPYSYIFKDEQNLKDYDDVNKWKQMLLFGAILTIFISSIGLFGLSVLSAEKRTKEIGIRKVLGASVNNVVTILSKDFIQLVAVALALAFPLAYFAGNKWLENFPYHIIISWWLFVAAATVVIFIAMFTISFQAIRAAVANPVKSLRSE